MKKFWLITVMIIVNLIFIPGCVESEEVCGDSDGYSDIGRLVTDYQIDESNIVFTPQGTEVDVSGFEINLDEIDMTTAATADCLGQNINPSALSIKVAIDWYKSSCTGAQIFPCDIGNNCGTPDPVNCPCACTGVTQRDLIIITPDLSAYRHELIHMVTCKKDGDPIFALCEKP